MLVERIRRNPGECALGTVLCIYAVIVLFFAKYAWLNPDGDCYAHEDGRHVSDMDDGESIDVALLFHNWFIDFLLLLLLPPLLVIFIHVMFYYFQERAREIIRTGNDLAWFVTSQVVIFFAFNLWIVLWGYTARYSDVGMACSGDFYTKNDEPEPYLWSSGKVIGGIVTFYMYVIAVIIISIIIIAITAFFGK